MDLFLKSFIVGFSIAAPVGPIGVLCIRRTLADGRIAGILSGLGAATADMIYGCLAAFGVTMVTNILLGQQIWLRLGGGILLCYLGVRTLIARPSQQAANINTNGHLGTYLSTVVLTLSNPMTIISFSAVFVGLGLAQTDATAGASLKLVLGVFTGSACWWLLLSEVVSLLRSRVNPQALVWVNRISGIVITSFGALSFISLLWG